MAAEDYFDPYGSPDDEEGNERSVECNRCGKSCLHWEQTENGWALYTENGKRHKCDPHRAARYDFKDLAA